MVCAVKTLAALSRPLAHSYAIIPPLPHLLCDLSHWYYVRPYIVSKCEKRKRETSSLAPDSWQRGSFGTRLRCIERLARNQRVTTSRFRHLLQRGLARTSYTSMMAAFSPLAACLVVRASEPAMSSEPSAVPAPSSGVVFFLQGLPFPVTLPASLELFF